MFIAIDAKADVTDSKKGRLTPAQHAQINAWSLTNKTGILDCLDRCEATTLNYTPSSNAITITFKHGYIAICGRIIECEANTTYTLTGLPNTGEVNGKIILRFNLAANGNSEFEITSKTGDLVQEDLNDNPITGIYEFELYSYTATQTSVVLKRSQEYISDFPTKLSPLDNYNNSKGTIEQRLTKLGFNTLSNRTISLSFTYSGANYSAGYINIYNLKREGYCVSNGIINFNSSIAGSFPSSSPQYAFYSGSVTATGTNATGFIPEHDISICLPVKVSINAGYTYTTSIPMIITFKANGTVEARCENTFISSTDSIAILPSSSQSIVNLGYKLKDI